MEEVAVDQRMFLRSVANGWGPARIAMVVIAYVTKDWRYTFLCCNFLAIPVIYIMIFKTVESTRWLAQQGDAKKVRSAEMWIAKYNRVESKSFLVAEKKTDKRVTYLDLFANRKIAFRTLIMAYIWFTCAFVSYGMDIKAGNLHGDIFLNQIIISFALAAARPLAFFIDRRHDWFDRRFLYLATIGLPVATFVLLAILSNYEDQKQSIGTVMTVLSVIQLVVLEYHWIAIGLYSSELFPTVCRGSGSALTAFVGRLGNVLAPQVMFLQLFYAPLPFVVFAAFGGLAIVVCWLFLPETKDEDLPDTLAFKVSAKVENEEEQAACAESLDANNRFD